MKNFNIKTTMKTISANGETFSNVSSREAYFNPSYAFPSTGDACCINLTVNS